MSDIDGRLVIYEDPFFSLRYSSHLTGNYQTSLFHRCTTYNGPAYTWHWRWSIFNECEICGIDIPKELMRTWRMLLMLDEVGIDWDFVRKVYQETTDQQAKLYYWRKIRYV